MGKSTQELKYKRLKVGHACYVCRSKKIKCDGLRPCMQCKARGRNCQSSNPAEASQHQHDHASISNTTDNGFASDDNSSSHRSQAESDDDSILFSTSRNSTLDSNASILKYNESWTSNVVIEASEDFKNHQKLNPNGGFAPYPAFGTFVRWRDEPPLPTKYTYPIEMPSSHIQMHMIDLFFKTRYKAVPIFPKRLFYDQLRVKGPLITPLLLNSIYCTVSAYATLPDVPKPVVFYNRAKKLLDDFLDTPRVSTAAALCLLALYEPLPTKSKNMPDQHCRSWMYSGMASRMCLELGLNIDTPRVRANKSPEEIELCRRVFWSCYCLDKIQSAEWERLWSIPASLARTAFPQLLPGDDEEERWIIMAYEEKIRLALIGEEGLQIRASFSIREDIQDDQYFSQLEEHRLKLLKWKNNLKSPELWGLSHCETVEQVVNEPKKSPIMSYLHIYYYFMLVDTIFCLPDTDNKLSLEHRLYASQLTKSIERIYEEPGMVIRYEFLAHAAIAAIRVHGRYINSPDQEIARQSWLFFHRCVKILRKFQKHAIIPECSAILAHLPALCQDNSSSSRKVFNGLENTTHMVQTLSTQDTQFSENNNLYVQQQQQDSNVPQVPSHHPHPIDLQQDQVLYENSAAAAYGFQPPLNNMSAASAMPQTVSRLHALGSSIGVDFGDRRQLWEHALQDVLSESNQYDISSSATTPESTTTPLTYNNDWPSSGTSPRATSEFIWPTTEPSQQQQHHSPPMQQQHMHHMTTSSSPLHQQQYEQQSQQQHFQQPSYNLSSSSPHHQHHHGINPVYASPYPQHQPQPQLSYVQPPHHQIPSNNLPYNMHNNHLNHNMSAPYYQN